MAVLLLGWPQHLHEGWMHLLNKSEIVSLVSEDATELPCSIKTYIVYIIIWFAVTHVYDRGVDFWDFSGHVSVLKRLSCFLTTGYDCIN